MSAKRNRMGSPLRRPLTKTMLLPLNAAAARAQSLNYHLAFAVCRSGSGKQDNFNQLTLVMYLTWLLQQRGYGALPVERYQAAEQGIESAFVRANDCGTWELTSEAAVSFEAILALHDSQLSIVPVHLIKSAEQVLMRVVAGEIPPPIPEAS